MVFFVVWFGVCSPGQAAEEEERFVDGEVARVELVAPGLEHGGLGLLLLMLLRLLVLVVLVLVVLVLAVLLLVVVVVVVLLLREEGMLGAGAEEGGRGLVVAGCM